MPRASHEEGFIRVGTCKECQGSEELRRDEGERFWNCLNCGRQITIPSPPKPKQNKPYDSMDQQKFEGFSCGVSEECLTCPLQKCENAWFKNLIAQAIAEKHPGRMPHPLHPEPTIHLNGNTKHLLQHLRWTHQTPPVPL